MTEALNLAPFEAETTFQALRPLVLEHVDIEVSGASVDDVHE